MEEVRFEIPYTTEMIVFSLIDWYGGPQLVRMCNFVLFVGYLNIRYALFHNRLERR